MNKMIFSNFGDDFRDGGKNHDKTRKDEVIDGSSFLISFYIKSSNIAIGRVIKYRRIEK